MEHSLKKIVVLFLAAFVVGTTTYSAVSLTTAHKTSEPPVKAVEKSKPVTVEEKTEPVEQPAATELKDVSNPSAKTEAPKSQPQPQSQPKSIDWTQPSGGVYPILNPNESIWIHVSKENQKVYIMDGNNIIYSMICSTGLDLNSDTSTPEGTFSIQRERGLSFYNASEKEGAKYWVSWKNHGEFLFHSVATDMNGNVIPSEAQKLGQKASHGCVRLTLPDAKWIYDNIQMNTKVVID